MLHETRSSERSNRCARQHCAPTQPPNLTNPSPHHWVSDLALENKIRNNLVSSNHVHVWPRQPKKPVSTPSFCAPPHSDVWIHVTMQCGVHNQLRGNLSATTSSRLHRTRWAPWPLSHLGKAAATLSTATPTLEQRETGNAMRLNPGEPIRWRCREKRPCQWSTLTATTHPLNWKSVLEDASCFLLPRPCSSNASVGMKRHTRRGQG